MINNYYHYVNMLVLYLVLLCMGVGCYPTDYFLVYKYVFCNKTDTDRMKMKTWDH